MGLVLKRFSRGIWGWLYISCTMLSSPYIIFLSGHFMYRVFHHVEHCFADIKLGLFWPPKNSNFGVTPVIETYKNYNTWGAGLVEIRGSIRTLSVLPTLLRYLDDFRVISAPGSSHAASERSAVLSRSGVAPSPRPRSTGSPPRWWSRHPRPGTYPSDSPGPQNRPGIMKERKFDILPVFPLSSDVLPCG